MGTWAAVTGLGAAGVGGGGGDGDRAGSGLTTATAVEMGVRATYTRGVQLPGF